jgi:catechol 2,3-dioxygenase-like lactoylglutathione lyase family enzyme
MFDRIRVMPMLPAQDLARARTWYADHLGLEPTLELGPQEINFFPGFVSYRSGYAGTARNTAALWIADDFDAALATLRERGVELETYDMPELTWADGVGTNSDGTRVLWFTDSEGNIMSMAELAPGVTPPGR